MKVLLEVGKHGQDVGTVLMCDANGENLKPGRVVALRCLRRRGFGLAGTAHVGRGSRYVWMKKGEG